MTEWLDGMGFDIFGRVEDRHDCIRIKVSKDHADFSVSEVCDAYVTASSHNVYTKVSIMTPLTYQHSVNLLACIATLLRTAIKEEAPIEF